MDEQNDGRRSICPFAMVTAPTPASDYRVADAHGARKIGGKSRSDLAKVRHFHVEECDAKEK
jgi:hypothetical protein